MVPASQLLEDYRSAFVRADLAALLDCFSFPLQVVSITGNHLSVAVADGQNWPDVLRGLLELYRRLGVADAAMLAVEISQPLDGLAIGRVHWDLQRKDGTSVYDFSAVYTMVRLDGTRKIVAIAHDELSQIRAAGLELETISLPAWAYGGSTGRKRGSSPYEPSSSTAPDRPTWSTSSTA